MRSRRSSPPSRDARARRRSQAGFTLVELLLATTLSLVVLGTAFVGFQGMLEATEGVGLIADVNLSLRSALNLLTRDLVSAGRDVPIGGIPIPSGVGVAALVRPGPPGAELVFAPGDTALPAVSTGDGLGPEIGGVATDVLTILMVDTTLTLASAFLADVAADGSSVTVADTVPIDDPGSGVAAGDLIMLSNSLGNALQMVTGRDGQTIQFAEGDAMNLNQRAAPQGTLLQLQSAPGEYPDTTATRVLMISYYIDADTVPGSPRLIRRENLGAERTIAVGVENLQFAYDLVDGDTDPVNVPEPVPPNTPDQIRKAHVFLSARSFREWRRSGEVLRSSLATQVGLRSLAFRDRY